MDRPQPARNGPTPAEVQGGGWIPRGVSSAGSRRLRGHPVDRLSFGGFPKPQRFLNSPSQAAGAGCLSVQERSCERSGQQPGCDRLSRYRRGCPFPAPSGAAPARTSNPDPESHSSCRFYGLCNNQVPEKTFSKSDLRPLALQNTLPLGRSCPFVCHHPCRFCLVLRHQQSRFSCSAFTKALGTSPSVSCPVDSPSNFPEVLPRG